MGLRALVILSLLPSSIAYVWSRRGTTLQKLQSLHRFSSRIPIDDEKSTVVLESGSEISVPEAIQDPDSNSKWSKLEAASRAAAAEYDSEQRRKVLLGIGSAIAGAGLFVFKRIALVLGTFQDPVVLLHRMEETSPPLNEALLSGQPTLIDFYADWCENCKVMAPLMKRLEEEYEGRVNFVSLNADRADGLNDDLVSLFRVDGIPHLALVDAQGNVQTALIGLVPDDVLRADLDALSSGLSQKPNGDDLPYVGYDAFGASRDRNILKSTVFGQGNKTPK